MCSGVWPGVCSTFDDDIAERKHLFVAHSPERKRDFRARPEHILCAGCLGELAGPRERWSA